MDADLLRKLLIDVKSGSISIDEALEKLKRLPFEDLGFAKLDSHRGLRCGFPEVIFCQGKTIDQVVSIVQRLLESGNNVLATRASKDIYQAVKDIDQSAEYNELARTIVIKRNEITKCNVGTILVVSAGTADLPVAEEASVTAETMGNHVERLYDVGVAGLHRLLSNKDKLFNANVIIVVAGMEGALASVVGGLVDKPVIAVPTSVGYGANFNGLSALLTMLNSCASGVSVVNIDNGFGAGYCAALINRLAQNILDKARGQCNNNSRG